MKINVKIAVLLFCFINGIISFAGAAPSADEGKKLFEANCASCHKVDKDLVGPALKDIDKRRDIGWIIKWVKNPQAVIKSGDAYATAIYNKFNQQNMTAFGSLKDDEIKSIVEYIKAYVPPAPAPGTETANDGKSVSKGADYGSATLIALLAIAILLIFIVMLLGRVNDVLKQRIYERKPELIPENQGYSFFRDTFMPWVRGWNKTVATVMAIVIFGVLFAYNGFQYANNEVGVQKGYSPTQPINFSHKIHAGDYKINCQYCHSSAEKSKQASIPSLSTCMNCHSYVTAKEKYNGQTSPEIAKIYKAIGFNEQNKKYDQPQSPIKWIRIHNLPDHAVFNHSTHVKLGKVACQKCHGEVQEMEVVYQRNSLQMGWCINCHRESNVDVASNPYYEKLHARLKKEGKTEIKVAQNGGLECSKCHY